MTRSQIFKTHMLSILISVWMILDLFLNSVVLPFFMMFWAAYKKDAGAKHSPYETMSARAGRGSVGQKPWPRRVTVPVIDFLFAWQKDCELLPDGRTFTNSSHTMRAFIKTKHGAYLPGAYHEPLPQSIEDCYSKPQPE